MDKRIPVGEVGTAVDVDNQRVTPGILARGPDDPAFKLPTVGSFEADVLGRLDELRSKKSIARM